jgi:REP element-mobilizing transposase RayT
MPHGPRLDAPDTLHHVMVRGTEGRAIFRDDQDREDFLRRLGAVAGATGLALYACALVPNHLHLLRRTGATPLARAMRSLLTGYAGAFHRRHRRRGHLFQNRFKSIVVEAEPYLLELVRYIHLNPLRALDRYPYTGHAVLLSRRRCPGQDTGSVLGRFAKRPGRTRLAYRAFVAAGIPQGRRPERQGGGLVRSLGGWAAVQAVRRGREHYAADEGVLGRPAFVEAHQRDIAARPAARRPTLPLAAMVRRVCAAVHVVPTALQAGGRRPGVWRAREGIAYLALDVGFTRPRGWSRSSGCGRPPSIRPPSGGGRTARDGIAS